MVKFILVTINVILGLWNLDAYIFPEAEPLVVNLLVGGFNFCAAGYISTVDMGGN